MTSTSSRRTLAVVTGASAGIGAEFARQLAARGHDLLLIARRKPRLDTLAAELQLKHGVEAFVLPLDLSDVDAPEAVRAEVERLARPVKWLINNAGYGLLGRFEKNSIADYRAMFHVLGTAPVELCYLLLPYLKASEPAHIVNVASLASYMPGQAGLNLYAGLKSLLVKFSESLAAELQFFGSRVSVTVTSPGMTESEIFEHAPKDVDVSQFKQQKFMTAASVVGHALEAAEQGRVSVIPGAHNRLAAAIFRYLPEGVTRGAVRRNEEAVLGKRAGA
ncbi:MAG: SDR family NAD(P)-dependent oxidoreductase [Caulobacteraceae bacterium]|nr:SDR family NAD(P)-dependent oxidoreductase [Caulobacteraceae bacterium]